MLIIAIEKEGKTDCVSSVVFLYKESTVFFCLFVF